MGDRNIRTQSDLDNLRKAREAEVHEYWIRYQYEKDKITIHFGGDTNVWIIKEVKLGRMSLVEAREELKKFKESKKDPWFCCFELLKVESVV